MSLTSLLRELSRSHFPEPPASPNQIADFESRIGWRLDEDLRAFYLHCNGAGLFRERFPPYWFLPLERIVRTRVAIHGRDEPQWGPASWYAICDLGDSDYASIDTGSTANGRYRLFDCFHETFYRPEERPMIASSFSEFLERALASGGHRFWL